MKKLIEDMKNANYFGLSFEQLIKYALILGAIIGLIAGFNIVACG